MATTSFTRSDLALAVPGNITTQGISQQTAIDPSLTFAGWFPTTIPVDPAPPIFRTEVEQLDLLRVAMLVIGVVIGARILR